MRGSEKTPEDCGCAPTPAERRAFWPVSPPHRARSRRVRSRRARGPRRAADPRRVRRAYPSWDDVENARANEAAKAGEVTRIEGLIPRSTQRSSARARRRSGPTSTTSPSRSSTTRLYRAEELQRQADEQAALALDSAQKAGRVAAQLYRNGGDDTSLELFFAGSAATTALLARLGTMDKSSSATRPCTPTPSRRATPRSRSATRPSSHARARSPAAGGAEDDRGAGRRGRRAGRPGRAESTSATCRRSSTLSGHHGQDDRRVRGGRRGGPDRRGAGAASGASGAPQCGSSAGSAVAAAAAAEAAAGRCRRRGRRGGWARPSSGAPFRLRAAERAVRHGLLLERIPPRGRPRHRVRRRDLRRPRGGRGLRRLQRRIRQLHPHRPRRRVATGYAHITDGGIRVRPANGSAPASSSPLEGNTGNSFGCHLHFETYKNGHR